MTHDIATRTGETIPTGRTGVMQGRRRIRIGCLALGLVLLHGQRGVAGLEHFPRLDIHQGRATHSGRGAHWL